MNWKLERMGMLGRPVIHAYQAPVGDAPGGHLTYDDRTKTVSGVNVPLHVIQQLLGMVIGAPSGN